MPEFWDTPQELRTKTYKDLFQSTPVTLRIRTDKKGHKFWPPFTTAPDQISRKCINTFLVSKRMYAEAKPLFLAYTPFTVAQGMLHEANIAMPTYSRPRKYWQLQDVKVLNFLDHQFGFLNEAKEGFALVIRRCSRTSDRFDLLSYRHGFVLDRAGIFHLDGFLRLGFEYAGEISCRLLIALHESNQGLFFHRICVMIIDEQRSVNIYGSSKHATRAVKAKLQKKEIFKPGTRITMYKTSTSELNRWAIDETNLQKTPETLGRIHDADEEQDSNASDDHGNMELDI
ncbi:hypothetical protein PMZ80_009277 [Knufia obscura]|uniref:Uncharacterized protein n=1 Tax=Knufia obscura TaxID=1635080 RepID=A0ABR0RCF7_9EURO|nr:hypothetical protein PMZ80_009277 [Knufia obscura]